MMALVVERGCAGDIFGDPGGQGGDPAGGPGHRGGIENPRFDGGDDIGVGDTVAGRHLQVQPGGHRGHPVADRAPVADHRAVETPLVAQHIGQQPAVLGGVHPVDPVVGAHHRGGPGLFDDVFEGPQIQFAQRALVDIRTDAHPVVLGIVDREMLQRCAHAVPLHPAHPCRAEHTGQQRIFGEVLEVAPAARVPLDVDPGPEQHLDTQGPALGTQGGADPFDELGIPGLAQADGGREAGRRFAAGQAEVVGGAAGLPAHPVRTVGQQDRRDIADLLGGPERRATAQGGLLGESEVLSHRSYSSPSRRAATAPRTRHRHRCGPDSARWPPGWRWPRPPRRHRRG